MKSFIYYEKENAIVKQVKFEVFFVFILLDGKTNEVTNVAMS